MDGKKKQEPADTSETAQLNANLRHWKALLESLPQVRMEKIRHARHAIEQHQYDDDGIMEVTLDRICSDMRLD